MPDWCPEGSLQAMAELHVATAILSVSTPGTAFLPTANDAHSLPSPLAFARPGHVTFGSDWPFAPVAAGKLFVAGLETYRGLEPAARAAIERANALALFPRLGAAPPNAGSALGAVRNAVSRAVMRGVVRLIDTR